MLPLIALAGCHPKAVVAPPPPPPAAAPPAPPLPPAPKCDALIENCTANESTTLAIAERGASLQPPSGWKYAKQSDRSIALSSEGKALLTVVEISTGTEGAVLEAVEKLSTATAIEKVKFDALKRRLKKPQITIDASGTPVDLWEVSKSAGNGSNPELLGQGSGTLLVFVARLTAERVIVGLGFVVVPDAEADAEKVMHAVQTLKGSPR